MRAAFPITTGQASTSGPKAVFDNPTLPASGSLDVDFVQEQAGNALDFIQSLYVNNKANGVTVEFIFPPGFSILVRANQQGVWPVICSAQGVRFRIVGTAGNVIPYIVSNASIPTGQWGI